MSRILTASDGPFWNEDMYRESRDPRFSELQAGQDAYERDLLEHHERYGRMGYGSDLVSEESGAISGARLSDDKLRSEGQRDALTEGGERGTNRARERNPNHGPAPSSVSADCPRCLGPIDEDGFCSLCGATWGEAA